MGGDFLEHYNVFFELASVCFLAVMIIIIHLKKQLDIMKNTLFLAGLYMVLIMNLLDVCSSAIINNNGVINGMELPIWASYVLMISAYVLQQAVMVLFLIYVHISLEMRRPSKFLSVMLLLISCIYWGLVLSTPYTGLMFTIHDHGKYTWGEYHFMYIAVPMVFALYAMLLVLAKRRKLNGLEQLTVAILCLATVGVVVLQIMVVPNFLLIYFWVTIVLTTVFMTLQSPDYYLDRSTTAFNSDGMHVVMNDRMDRQKNFSMLFISAHDFEGIKDGFSAQNKRLVYHKICTEIMSSQYVKRSKKKAQAKSGELVLKCAQKKRTIEVFRDDDKIYVMFYDVPSAEQNAIDIGTWLTEGIQIDGVEQPVKIVAKMLLFDYPSDIRSEEEFNSVIKYFMKNDFYNQYNVLNSVNDEFFRKKKRYEDVRGLVEEAIRTEGIEMFYQPIFSTEKKDFHSSEALVRLRDTDSIGFVSPEEFIRIAEKEHLILQLEKIILRKTCKFIANAHLDRLGVQYIEVNLSGNQCIQKDLYIDLQELLEEFNIPAGFVNFEVTETAQIGDSKILKHSMEQMKKYGSSFSLDDYGSGASNLQYLVDYPFDLVKLDKSIVWTHFRDNSQKTRPVLPQSVRMLREMGVDIVAEGVEYEEEVRGLIGMGVQYLQGYYFSKPICEKDYLKFLKEHQPTVEKAY